MTANTKRYLVTFEIELNTDSPHPRKWIPDTIGEALEVGEDVTSWNFEELSDANPE